MENLNIITGYISGHWIDIIGYIASIFVAATFYMKTIIPLRIFAIISNIFFVTYGFFGALYPVLILHIFLFPLNIFRLVQMKRLIKDVQQAMDDDGAMKPLIPYMSKSYFEEGDVLFRKGDKADKMYYIASGSVKLTDLDISVSSGQILGEMGIFSPFRERTDTAVCESRLEIFTIDEDKIKQLYYQNPTFGFYLIKLLTKRFIANYIKMMNIYQDRTDQD